MFYWWLIPITCFDLLLKLCEKQCSPNIKETIVCSDIILATQTEFCTIHINQHLTTIIKLKHHAKPKYEA